MEIAAESAQRKVNPASIPANKRRQAKQKN